MLSVPSCNGCNYFKKKGMPKYQSNYIKSAEFWWIDAESSFGEGKNWHKNRAFMYRVS